MLETTEAQQAEIAKYEFCYRDPNYRMGAQRMEQSQRALKELPYRGSYLDVGCGRGEMLDFAREIGFVAVLGTEVVHALLQRSDVVSALAWKLPLRDRGWEVVSFFDVIEHLLPGDDELACRELARVARKTILITANNLTSRPHNQQSMELHVNRRPYEEWDQLFKAWFPGNVTWLKDYRAKVSEMWRIDL